MSLRHTLARTGMVLAAGTLIAAAGAGPALAAGKPTATMGTGPGIADDSGIRDWDSRDWDNGDWDNGEDPYFDDDGLGDSHFDDPYYDGRLDDHRRFEGRIISRNGLALHNRPDRRSRIIRIAPFGERVHIYCKTTGERVGGNPIWYLITDGTWSWGSAQHIDNIGPSPRWC